MPRYTIGIFFTKTIAERKRHLSDNETVWLLHGPPAPGSPAR